MPNQKTTPTEAKTVSKVSAKEKITNLYNRKFMFRGEKYHLGETCAAYTLLLPTIISRCRSLKLHSWSDDVIVKALERNGVPAFQAKQAAGASGGSIGKALAVAADETFWKRRKDIMSDFLNMTSRSDILSVSSAWRERKDEAGELLNDLEDMIRTLMFVRLGRMPAEESIDAYPDAWKQMAASAPLNSFIELMDAVAEARKLRSSQVNWQAALEKLLLRLMEEKNKWSK